MQQEILTVFCKKFFLFVGKVVKIDHRVSKLSLRTLRFLRFSWYSKSSFVRMLLFLRFCLEFNQITLLRSFAVTLSSKTVIIFGHPQHWVLLDEFSPEELRELVPRLRSLSPRPVVLEASGVQPDQLRAYGATGIDLISTSAPVTRSSWLDLSMRFSG